MDLDLSVITFSPSQVKKQNFKTPSSNKKATKLTLRRRRLGSSKENYCSEDGKFYSTSVNKNCQDESISPIRKSSDMRQFRSAKGKENRGINVNCISLLLSDPSHIVNGTSSTQGCFKNKRRRRRRLSSGDNTRQSKRFSGDSSKSETNIDHSWLVKSNSFSKEQHIISQANKNSQQSTQRSLTVLANESLEQSYTKTKIINEKSIILISDSGEENADVSMKSIDGIQNRQPLLDHQPNMQKQGPCRFTTTIVLETSESDNEHSQKCNEISATKPQSIKSTPESRLKALSLISSPCEDKENVGHQGNKFTDIKNWLSGTSSYNKKCSTASKVDNVKSSKNIQKQTLSKKSKAKTPSHELDSSALHVLNEIYGLDWQRGTKKAQTEPHKATNYRDVNSASDVSDTSCSDSSESNSADFERFLNERRAGKFESTRRFSNAPLGTPEFLNDSVEENSLGFYQGLHTDEIKSDAKKVNKFIETDSSNASNKSNNISRRLSFSSCSNDEGAVTPKAKPKKAAKDLKNAKKEKVIVSPVNSRLKTPKTEKPYRSKPVLKAKQVSIHCSPVLSFLSSLSADASKDRCHPEALYYKQDFQKKKEKLCRKLFTLYNNEVFDKKLPEDLLIQWSARINKSAGLCYNKRTIKNPGTKVRTSRIALSTKVCDTPDRLRDTLIHELCHAACWIVDEVKDCHGPKWKAWARKAMRAFPELPLISRCHDYKIFTKYTYKCTRCGYSLGRHSKSLDLATNRCGYCYGTFELLVNTRRKSGTVAQMTPKKRSPAGFARFVKENYGTVKKIRSDLKHADVMKLLGQQFSAFKIASA